MEQGIENVKPFKLLVILPGVAPHKGINQVDKICLVSFCSYHEYHSVNYSEKVPCNIHLSSFATASNTIHIMGCLTSVIAQGALKPL